MDLKMMPSFEIIEKRVKVKVITNTMSCFSFRGIEDASGSGGEVL